SGKTACGAGCGRRASNGYCSTYERDRDLFAGCCNRDRGSQRVAPPVGEGRRRGTAAAAKEAPPREVEPPRGPSGSRGVRALRRTRSRGAADDRRAGREEAVGRYHTVTVRWIEAVFGLIAATSSMFFSSW